MLNIANNMPLFNTKFSRKCSQFLTVAWWDGSILEQLSDVCPRGKIIYGSSLPIGRSWCLRKRKVVTCIVRIWLRCRNSWKLWPNPLCLSAPFAQHSIFLQTSFSHIHKLYHQKRKISHLKINYPNHLAMKQTRQSAIKGSQNWELPILDW